jgi:lysophospholipase L1-like esterase
MPKSALSRRLAIIAGLAGLLANLSACSSFAPPPAAPTLRTGALDQVGPRLTNYGTAVVRPGAVITVWGDDFTGPSPDAPHPKGRTMTLARALAAATGLKVIDHETPGQTAAEGLAQLTAGDGGALLVLCYGYGDASLHTTGFQAALDRMIRLAHERGEAVLLVTEPPLEVVVSKAPTARETRLKTFADQVSALQDIVRLEAPAAGAGLVDSTPVLSPPAARSDRAQRWGRNGSLTP